MLLINKSDFSLFDQISQEVVRIYNLFKDGNELFRSNHVEVHSMIEDYNDGQGKRLISRGVIIYPDRSKTALVVDIEGTSIEALKALKATVLKMLEEDFPEEYIEYLYSLN